MKAPDREPGRKFTDRMVENAFNDPFWGWDPYGFKVLLKPYEVIIPAHCKNVISELIKSDLPITHPVERLPLQSPLVQRWVSEQLRNRIKNTEQQFGPMMLAMLDSTRAEDD
ncbi:hypothetical protein ABW19_dt0209203 [Dactylella cylindrospora]|nr:hypothetical protein ABW19_dt0209203 [Dactylella cylindrospora]